MAVYEVYSYPVFNKYKTTICSKATIFLVVVAIFTYISPLLLAYRSYGFWLRSDTYIEQPFVRFKHQFLLLAETASFDAPILCSTFDELNLQMQKHSRCSIVKSRELDINRDGKTDEIDFEIEVQLFNDEDIYAITLILLFDYRLSVLCHLHMESAAFIQYTSALPGVRFDLMGDLSLIQKIPLTQLLGVDSRYNDSVFGNQDKLQSYHLPTVFKDYFKRNVTTRVQNKYYTWQTGRAFGDPFVMSVSVHVPEQRILYQPGFWQVMKWAWLQYFALLVIIKSFTEALKRWVFSQHVVPVVKMPPPWKKTF